MSFQFPSDVMLRAMLGDTCQPHWDWSLNSPLGWLFVLHLGWWVSLIYFGCKWFCVLGPLPGVLCYQTIDKPLYFDILAGHLIRHAVLQVCVSIFNNISAIKFFIVNLFGLEFLLFFWLCSFFLGAHLLGWTEEFSSPVTFLLFWGLLVALWETWVQLETFPADYSHGVFHCGVTGRICYIVNLYLSACFFWLSPSWVNFRFFPDIHLFSTLFGPVYHL